MRGSGEERVTVKWRGQRSPGSFSTVFEGLLPRMMRRFQETQSEEMKQWYGKFMSTRRCETCDGMRLKPEVLAVRVGSKSVMEVCFDLDEAWVTFCNEADDNHTIFLVFGNSPNEIVADWGFAVDDPDGFDAAITAATDAIQTEEFFNR